jgi:hypothetical protein
MSLKLLLTFLTTIIPIKIFAQKSDSFANTDNPKHHKHEIAIAISPPYFIKEKMVSLSLHAHYVYNIPKTKLGIGSSYERILLNPKHHTFGLVTSIRPTESLKFSISPGITFEDNNSTPFFSLHTETSYEFEIGLYHIGPAFEFAYDPNDYHLSLGLHLGLGF